MERAENEWQRMSANVKFENFSIGVDGKFHDFPNGIYTLADDFLRVLLPADIAPNASTWIRKLDSI